MITPAEAADLERRAMRMATIRDMVNFLHTETLKPVWLCHVWARFIVLKHDLKINGDHE
jgi:hypothetical protein